MKFSLQKIAIGLSAMFLIASTVESGAFALLGPVQPWMQATNGVILPGDIGGPMCLSNEYRWNVPVVTYGFDQSFLNYFGSNGVAAVEGAIQILNNLPAASQIVLTNYSFDSRGQNYAAQAQWLQDLKSTTLSLLLEQLGLAQPTRNIYVLHDWDPSFFPNLTQNDYFLIVGMPIFYESGPDGVDSGASGNSPGYITNFVSGFNFDPATLNPSISVNTVGYACQIGFFNLGQPYLSPFAIDPLADTFSAVADAAPAPGAFYNNLTFDDVGGLAYLLSTNNVNYETLLPGIAGVGANSSSFVNGAWRPGVGKITFVPQPVNPQSGTFLPMTNCFADSYFTNGVLKQQQMARTIAQPDFLFSAGDVTSDLPEMPFYFRSGTTNWLNHATANGNTNGAGPGVIPPPVQIVFNKVGRLLSSDANTSENQAVDYSQLWASFDDSTNPPVIYPVSQTGSNQLTVHMWLDFGANNARSLVWQPSSLSGAQFTMQTSTNLASWTTLFTVTNNGSVCTYLNEKPASASRFYRLIQQ